MRANILIPYSGVLAATGWLVQNVEPKLPDVAPWLFGVAAVVFIIGAVLHLCDYE